MQTNTEPLQRRTPYDPLQRMRFNTFPGQRREWRVRLSEDLAREVGKYQRTLQDSLGRPPSRCLTVEVLLRKGLGMSLVEQQRREGE